MPYIYDDTHVRARRVCVCLHVRVMIEERGSENELRFAKPSFAARPMRLDPSHFYHPGLATTDESRIGCGGTNERGGEEGGPEGQERQSVVSGPSCAPSRGPSRLPARLALPSPHQPAGSFELAAFCGVQPPRDSERRTQRPRRALTQPPFLGCRKRYLTSWPAVLLVPCRHHPCERAPTTPSACPAVSAFTPLATPLQAPPTTATARGRHERPYERTSRLHRPREKIASLRFKCYEWRAWQIARWLLSRLAKLPRSTAAMHALRSRCDTTIIATEREG